MIKIGDKISQIVYMGESKCNDVGEVVYIHPQYRFYMLLFHGKNGDVRECYKFNIREQVKPIRQLPGEFM